MSTLNHSAAIALFLKLSSMLLPAQAQTMAIELGDNDYNLTYEAQINAHDESPVIFDSSLLYTKQNEHQDLLGGVGVRTTVIESGQYSFALAGKLFATDVFDYELTTVAAGAVFSYKLTAAAESAVSASLYLAPEQLTFMDGDKFILVDVSIKLLTTTDYGFRMGYRRVITGIIDHADIDLDRGAYLGLSIHY